MVKDYIGTSPTGAVVTALSLLGISAEQRVDFFSFSEQLKIASYTDVRFRVSDTAAISAP